MYRKGAEFCRHSGNCDNEHFLFPKVPEKQEKFRYWIDVDKHVVFFCFYTVRLQTQAHYSPANKC